MYMSEKREKEKKKKEYRIDDGAIGNDHRQFVAAQHQKDLFSLFSLPSIERGERPGQIGIDLRHSFKF